MQNKQTSIEQRYKNLLIIWAAMLMSQFIFLLVIFLLKPEMFRLDFSKPLLGENQTIVIAFLFIALSNFVFSFVLKNNFLNRAAQEQNAGIVQTALIIAIALCEMISLFGFVLAFAFNYQYFFIWLALGILGIILHFPKRESLHLATYQKTKKF